MVLRYLLSALLLCALSSCTGYQIGDRKPAEFASIESISVPLVENKTQEQRLATLVTNSIVDEITRDGTYSLSSDNLSDATLTASIETVRYRQRRADRFDSLRAAEMYIELEINWQLTNEQNVVLMKGSEKGVSYFTVASNQQLSRNNAFPDAAKNAAEKIVQRIANGF
jgi:hypothetical protein